MADLHHMGRRVGRRRAAELLERFDLVEAGGAMASTYSGGMQRRLDLAMTLVGAPQVIFLDEPTAGLDPRSRRGLWQIIRELVAGGVTIFLTTQYLEEADRLADRIAIIDGGRMVAEGTAPELKHRIAEQRLDLTLATAGAFDQVRRQLGDRASAADPLHRLISVPTDGGAPRIRALLDELDPDRSAIARFAVHEASLDDVFLALTGRPTSRDSPRTAETKETSDV
jgi:ABC-2 type transport system ATP-binding protein